MRLDIYEFKLASCMCKISSTHVVRTDCANAGFIYGAVNIPLYQPIAKWDALSIARRAGFALFGVLNGTEPNPDFLAGALMFTCCWLSAR